MSTPLLLYLIDGAEMTGLHDAGCPTAALPSTVNVFSVLGS